MRNTSFDISGKIDRSLVRVLGQFKKVADDLNIPFLVVGATARDFVLEYRYDVKSPRMTKDIDLGVRVPGWEKFKALSNGLLATNRFSKAREKQRFVCDSIPIDIIPFGPIANDERRIRWPPGDERIMSTLGFEEAYEHAEMVRLSTDPVLEVTVPTIPGLSIIKLVSWNEQPSLRKKDAEDLLFIMKNYQHAEIEDRLYEQETPLLEEEDFDNQLAGIRLLGHDMAKISQPATLNEIRGVLLRETEEQRSCNLVVDMLGFSDQFDTVLLMLRKLTKGIIESSSK